MPMNTMNISCTSTSLSVASNATFFYSKCYSHNNNALSGRALFCVVPFNLKSKCNFKLYLHVNKKKLFYHANTNLFYFFI